MKIYITLFIRTIAAKTYTLLQSYDEFCIPVLYTSTATFRSIFHFVLIRKIRLTLVILQLGEEVVVTKCEIRDMRMVDQNIRSKGIQ